MANGFPRLHVHLGDVSRLIEVVTARLEAAHGAYPASYWKETPVIVESTTASIFDSAKITGISFVDEQNFDSSYIETLDLVHVPDDYFELVSIANIRPSWDPMQYSLDRDNNFDRYRKLCKRSQAGIHEELIGFAVGEHRNSLYGSWLSQAIRVAKPGAPIIIEQRSDAPYCNAFFFPEDEGVALNFWRQAMTFYNLDVDPHSI